TWRAVPVVVAPRLAIDGPQQLRPQALRFDAEQPEPAVVRGAVRVDHRVRLLGARQRATQATEAQLQTEVPAEAVDAGAQQRHVDELTLAGLLATPQRAEDAGQRGDGGDVITDAAAEVRLWRVGGNGQRGETRTRPERADVVPRAPRLRPFPPVTRHAGVHEP